MTHFAASSVTKAILDKMRRAYEMLLTKGKSIFLFILDPAFVCLSVFM